MAWGRKYSLVMAPTGAEKGSLSKGIQDASGIDVSNLRCRFMVKKTLKPKPNHAVIHVYNMSSANRFLVSNTAAISLQLDAGYEDEGTSTIYFGEVRTGDTKQEGPLYVTKLDTDDKGRKLQKVQINTGVHPGMSVESVFRLLLDSFNLKVTGDAWGNVKIGEGNLASAMGQLRNLGITSLHPKGGVLSGYSTQLMTELCDSADLEWSIQDGALFILPRGAALGGKVISLSSSSGLIGSPEIDNEGRLTAECLMLPGIRCGVIVNFDSKFLKGNYRLTSVEWHGDTHGHDWKIRMHGEKH